MDQFGIFVGPLTVVDLSTILWAGSNVFYAKRRKMFLFHVRSHPFCEDRIMRLLKPLPFGVVVVIAVAVACVVAEGTTHAALVASQSY